MNLSISIVDNEYEVPVTIFNKFTQLGEQYGLESFTDINGSFSQGSKMSLEKASRCIAQYYLLCINLGVTKYFKARII